MKLTYYKSKPSNFGDELNAFMWSELLPEGFLNENGSDLFVGIGSIISDSLSQTAMKHVLGAGFGGYSRLPNVRQPDWNIVWVRGPRTAALLRLDPKLAICDAATLIRHIKLPDPMVGLKIGFMPHFQSIRRGLWQEVCALVGITFIDPTDRPMALISKIRGLNMIVTEAMHGAIVADALRVPWIPVLPFQTIHRMKWHDWAGSIEIKLRPVSLRPSSLLEAWTTFSDKDFRGPRWDALNTHYALSVPNAAFAHLAASRLRKIVERIEPQLSMESTMERITDRALTALHDFVRSRSNRILGQNAG